jgi:hypothetical protein
MHMDRLAAGGTETSGYWRTAVPAKSVAVFAGCPGRFLDGAGNQTRRGQPRRRIQIHAPFAPAPIAPAQGATPAYAETLAIVAPERKPVSACEEAASGVCQKALPPKSSSVSTRLWPRPQVGSEALAAVMGLQGRGR